MPPEVLIIIFNYLDTLDWLNIKLVCQQWRDIGDYIFNPLDVEDIFTKVTLPEAAQFLLNKCISPYGLISSASIFGHIEVVKVILQKPGLDPIIYNWSLNNAAQNGHLEIVKLLLQDERVGTNKPLLLASAHGHLEIVKILLQDKRTDPRFNDNYAIQLAAIYGYTEVVKLLLQDPRVDPSAFNNYAVKCAKHRGCTEVVKILLQDSRVNLPE